MRRALALLAISILFGCQSAPAPAPRVAALVLRQPLTVPTARAAIEVQAGELRDGRIDPYRPYCRFELARLADGAREIAPGRYPILRQYESVPAAAAPTGFRYANFTPAADDPSYYVFATVFELAANNAGLSRLACQHWELPAPNPPRHLTPNEISGALGAIARLE